MTRWLAIAAILFSAAPVAAQSRFEAGVGVTWTGGFDAGGTDALLTRNPSTGTTPLALFDTSSRFEAAAGAIGRAGIFVTPRIALEAMVEYSRPVLRTRISSDFEGATGTEAVSQLASYVFGGSLLYHFGTRRLVPFVAAGAGRLRQLDDGNVTLVTGTEVHGGGGVKFRMAGHLGLRADAVVSSRDKSIAFDAKRHIVPRFSAGVIWRF